MRKFILQQCNETTAESRWLPDYIGPTDIYGVSSAVKAPDSMAQFSESHLIWLEKGFLATGPCPNGKIRWDLILPESEPPSSAHPPSQSLDSQSKPWQSSVAQSPYTLQSTIDILRKHQTLHHPYVGTLPSLITNTDRIIRTSLRQRVWTIPEIQNRNTLFIGDAARLMLPTRGQGTSFAIDDGTILARCLFRHETNQRTALE